MPFLGQIPDQQYRTIAKQTITGNGGTTYTLDNTVGSPNELEVFVNNVRQEPTVAYTASGASITFTTALEASDECYVIYQGQAITSNLIQSQNIEDGSITAAKLDKTYVDKTGDSITGTLDLTNGGLIIPKVSSAPGSPIAGQVYYDTTQNNAYWYDGGTSSFVEFGSAKPYQIEYMVIAGGGAGGSDRGGGGGAGGYLSGSMNVGTADEFPIVIGAGGSGGANTFANGNNTTAFSLTAIAGGGGGNCYVQVHPDGGNGGSGGGKSNQGSVAGSGTSGQGFAGGTNGGLTAGGGGGGATGVGGDAYSGNGGAGGPGATWVDGSTRAGGGGGAYGSGGTGGPGAAGGGNGSAGDGNANAGSASANTGSGGGGATGGGSASSGSGGSGIVKIRYAGSQRGTGGTVTSSGGYTYHTFTSSGTYIA